MVEKLQLQVPNLRTQEIELNLELGALKPKL